MALFVTPLQPFPRFNKLGCKLIITSLISVSCLSTSFAQEQESTRFDTIPNPYNLQFSDRPVQLWKKSIQEEFKTGATHTIYERDLTTTPVSELKQVLGGRLTGLYSRQSSGRAGADFSAPGLLLRGKSPIVVVDGIIRPFTNLSFQDIESVTVQKDAFSTAMNGQLSSAGVIYIKTKTQSKNGPFEINFNVQHGFLEGIKPPKFVDAYSYASLYNEAQQNTNPNAIPRFSQNQLDAYRNGTNDPYRQPYVDWYNLIYKNTSQQQRYNINVGGKGDSFRYFAAGEYFKQGGNFITDPENPYNTNNDYDRYNLRTNAEVKFNKNIALDVNIFGSFEKYNEAGSGTGAIMNRIFYVPRTEFPLRNEDGSFSGVSKWLQNPVANSINSGYIQTSKRSVNADVALNFKLDDLLEGLWAKGAISFNNYYAEAVVREKKTAIFIPQYGEDGSVTYIQNGTETVIEAGAGRATVNDQFNQNYLGGIIGYSPVLDNQKLDIRLVYNNYRTSIDYVELDELYQNYGLEGNYVLKDRYLFDAVLTYSSLNRYRPDNRWVFSPAVGLGWIINKEDWFKDQDLFNFMKLRATIGQTSWSGNVGYFAYLQNYAVNTDGYSFGSSPGGVKGTVENILANPNLEPEKAIKWDVGLDVTLLDEKLNFSFDYYADHYKGILAKRFAGNNSGIIGQTLPFENIGKQRYSGFEISLGFRNSKSTPFRYFINGNFSSAQSREIYTGEGTYPYAWMYRQGGPVNQNFGYEFEGFYTGKETEPVPTMAGYTLKPGDLRYKDLNQDGVISDFDKKNVTGEKPLYFYGLNLGVSYRGFDVNALLQGTINSRTMLSGLYMSAFNNSAGYVLDYTTENRWTAENPNADLPRLTLGPNANNQATSSFWVRNTSYLRLKNVEIGYTLPADFTKRMRMQNVRFFVNGYNLWTVSKMKYMDPESLLSGFPNQRIINAGFSFQL